MKIRNKIFLNFLLLIIIPTMFADELLFNFVKQELTKNEFSKLNVVADSRVNSIISYFNERQTDLREFQHSNFLTTYMHSLTNPNNGDNTSIMKFREALGQELRPVQKTHGVQNVMLLNPSGIVLFNSNPVHYDTKVGLPFSDASQAVLGKNYRKHFVSNIYFDERPEHGGELFIGGPILGNNNEFLGTIFIEMNLDALDKLILDTSGLGVSGEAILIRQDGKQALVLTPIRHDPDAAMTRTVSFDQAGSMPFKRALNGKNGSGMGLDYRGKQVISAWRYLEGQQWGLIVKIDQEEALASIQKIKKFTVIILILSLIAIFIASIIISKKILKPLAAIQAGARRFSEDDLDFRINIPGGDELFQLAISFNNMAASLANSRLGLEEKVCQRTAELETLNTELTVLTRAVKQSPVAIIITNHQERIQYINPSFTMMTEYSLADVQNKPIDILLGSPDNPQHTEIWNSVRTGIVWHGELQIRGKDSELIWVKKSIAPIFDKQKEIINFVIIIEDISEQKEAEETRSVQIKELNDMRHAMLNMLDDLKKSNLKAEAASRAKSDFLANMSHEIRTPMNAIIGMTYLTLKTELTHQQHDYLEKIGISARALLELINDVLDFSKIEAGKMELEQTEFNLDTLIDKVIILSYEKIASKDIEIFLDIDQHIPKVLVGDPVRVAQIFSNLLSNAAKFTDKGNIEISAKTISRDQNILLECAVSDTGIGMSKEQIALIFKKFTQANTSTTREYGGTGLGLAICAQLVELMGGDIWVKSHDGHGSTFTFTLALGYREGHDLIPPKDRVPANLRHMKVLVLVESERLQEILSTQLAALELIAESTSNPHNLSPFGLVIADFKLLNDISKERDAIFSELLTSQTPLIIMASINDTIEANERIKEFPKACLMTKPASASTFYDTIEKLVAPKSNQLSASPDSSASNHNFKDIRVLLVEDNSFNQLVASEILKQVGVEVTTANNGEEAVRLVQENVYDLVFMDIQMPLMDGWVATKTIRKLGGNYTKLPIVAMTANVMPSDMKKSLATGMDDHINKPFVPEEIFACLKKLTTHHQSTPPLNPPTEDRRLRHLEEETGLNIEIGLMRLRNNNELYCRILWDFANDNDTFKDNLQEAIAVNDYEKAHRLVHTLKGIAGTIGAERLQQLAADLEKDISATTTIVCESKKKDIDNKIEMIDLLIQELCTATHNELAPQAPKPRQTTNSKIIPNEVLRRELVNLNDLLACNSMKASSIFTTLKNDLSVLWPEGTETINTALENFDFKTARKVLENFHATEL